MQVQLPKTDFPMKGNLSQTEPARIAAWLKHGVYQKILNRPAPKGTFVRLLAPPAEGRVVRGERGLDVGDSVKVKLLATTPEKGFIDFACH